MVSKSCNTLVESVEKYYNQNRWKLKKFQDMLPSMIRFDMQYGCSLGSNFLSPRDRACFHAASKRFHGLHARIAPFDAFKMLRELGRSNNSRVFCTLIKSREYEEILPCWWDELSTDLVSSCVDITIWRALITAHDFEMGPMTPWENIFSRGIMNPIIEEIVELLIAHGFRMTYETYDGGHALDLLISLADELIFKNEEKWKAVVLICLREGCRIKETSIRAYLRESTAGRGYNQPQPLGKFIKKCIAKDENVLERDCKTHCLVFCHNFPCFKRIK